MKKETTNRTKPESMKKIGRAPKPPSGMLTENSITAAALELIDREGLERFSLRNLASSLRVYPAAIYWYLPSKDLVTAAVMNLVLRDIAPDVNPKSWKEYLRALMHHCRAAIRQHPNTAPLLGAQLTANAHADFALIEGILSALTYAGFQKNSLANAYNATIAVLSGFATLEYSPIPEGDDDWQSQIKQRLDAITVEAYPTLAENLPRLKNKSFVLRWDNGIAVPLDDSFNFHVEIFISGLENLRRKQSGNSGESEGNNQQTGVRTRQRTVQR